ncbi:MAG: magnesium and cobalt transport protein CorA [Calditrichaeota bacterium]|nr:MAG: magnesium and cobalt transport protein CorA [Calditrichota bacterium]
MFENRHKRRSKKSGLPPGSYVFLGEKRQEQIEISLMRYDVSNFEFRMLETIEETFQYKDNKNVTWINIYGLHDTALLKKIETAFGIHPLVLEDVLNTTQRPKIEIFHDYVFSVLKMISFNKENEQISTEQISLILKNNHILCFQERKGDIFHALRERIKNATGRIRKSRADYLAYAIMDVIVDNYFLVLEELAEHIEMLDEEVADDPDPETAQKINGLKHALLMLRKNTWPLREVIHQLVRDENPQFHQETMPFLRDLYDHVLQVIDTTETCREMTNGLMDMYMSMMSNRMNEVMKVLTIIATIFIPLSFLAGVYGMNFDTSISPFNMPELSFKFGYIMFWLFSLAIGAGLLLYFKKKKWL